MPHPSKRTCNTIPACQVDREDHPTLLLQMWRPKDDDKCDCTQRVGRYLRDAAWVNTHSSTSFALRKKREIAYQGESNVLRPSRAVSQGPKPNTVLFVHPLDLESRAFHNTGQECANPYPLLPTPSYLPCRASCAVSPKHTDFR